MNSHDENVDDYDDEDIKTYSGFQKPVFDMKWILRQIRKEEERIINEAYWDCDAEEFPDCR